MTENMIVRLEKRRRVEKESKLDEMETKFKVVSVNIDDASLVPVGEAVATTAVATENAAVDPTNNADPLVQWFYSRKSGASQADGIAQLVDGETTLFEAAAKIAREEMATAQQMLDEARARLMELEELEGGEEDHRKSKKKKERVIEVRQEMEALQAMLEEDSGKTYGIDENMFMLYCMDSIQDMLRPADEVVRDSMLEHVHDTRVNIPPPKDFHTPLHRNAKLESTDFMKKKQNKNKKKENNNSSKIRFERGIETVVETTDPSMKAMSKFRSEVVKNITTSKSKLFDMKIKITLQAARAIEMALRKYRNDAQEDEDNDDMDEWLRTRGEGLAKAVDLEDWMCSIEEDENEKGTTQRKREQMLTTVFDLDESVLIRTEAHEERLAWLSERTDQDILTQYPSIILMGMDTTRFLTAPLELLRAALVPELTVAAEGEGENEIDKVLHPTLATLPIMQRMRMCMHAALTHRTLAVLGRTLPVLTGGEMLDEIKDMIVMRDEREITEKRKKEKREVRKELEGLKNPKEVKGWGTTVGMPMPTPIKGDDEEEEEEDNDDDMFLFASAEGGDESAPPMEEEEIQEEGEEEGEEEEEREGDTVLAQCLKELDDIRMAEYALSRAEHMLLVSNTTDKDLDGRLATLRHAGLGTALDDASLSLKRARALPLSSVPSSWSVAFDKVEEISKRQLQVRKEAEKRREKERLEREERLNVLLGGSPSGGDDSAKKEEEVAAAWKHIPGEMWRTEKPALHGTKKRTTATISTTLPLPPPTTVQAATNRIKERKERSNNRRDRTIEETPMETETKMASEEEKILRSKLDVIERAADICESASNEYNSVRARTISIKSQLERARRECNERKEACERKKKEWAIEVSRGGESGGSGSGKERAFNEDEWVQERDGFTGRTEWMNVNTKERRTGRPCAPVITSFEEKDTAEETKREFEDAVASMEEATSYVETKREQWREAKTREEEAREKMLAAKEELRDLSMNVLTNIPDGGAEEEKKESVLPLPTRTTPKIWKAAANGGEKKTKSDEKENNQNNSRGGGGGGGRRRKRESLSKERKEYDAQWETEMKEMVVDIAQDDRRVNQWAARAAKLVTVSSKPRLEMKRDGSVSEL